jgi:hypothetical protein
MIAAAATTTAASAVAALASASAAPATSRSTASTTATTTRAAAPTSAFAHRAGLIHYQRTAQKILAIAGLNSALGFFVVVEFREAETTRLAGKLIADNLNGIGLKSVPCEPVL